MKYRLLIFAILFVFCGCHSENKDSFLLTTLLYDVDSLSVHYYSDKSNTGKGTTDSSQIRTITELLTKKSDRDTTSCKYSGNISFYKKNTLAYSVFFSTGKKEGADCEQLIYNIEGKKHCVPLSYQAGMFISSMK